MSDDASLLAVGVETDGSIPEVSHQLDRLSDSAQKAVDANDKMLESWARDAVLMNATKAETLAYDGALAGLTSTQQEYLAEIMELVKVQEQYLEGQKMADATTRQLTKAWDEAYATAQKLDAEANKFVKSLQDQASAIGKTRSEVMQLALDQRKLTDAQRESAQAAVDQIRSAEKLAQANKAVAEANKAAADAARDQAREEKKAADERNRSIEGMLGGLLKWASGIYVAKAAWDLMVDTMNKSIEAGKEAEQGNLRMEAVLKATGAQAGITKEQILGIADALSKTTKFDDDGLKKAGTSLLVFERIGADSFERVLKASTDLAAFMGTDLDAAVKLVGRAMESPEQGMNALRRAGIILTESQKELVAAFMESGDVIAAQSVILDVLESKIGGTAETMNQGMTKSSDDLSKALDDLYKEIGKTNTVTSSYKMSVDLTTEALGIMQTAVKNSNDPLNAQNAVIAGLSGNWAKLTFAVYDYVRAAAIASNTKVTVPSPGDQDQVSAGLALAAAQQQAAEKSMVAKRAYDEAMKAVIKLEEKHMSATEKIRQSNAVIAAYGKALGLATADVKRLQDAEAAAINKRASAGGKQTNALKEYIDGLREQEQALGRSLDNEDKLRKASLASQLKDIDHMRKMQVMSVREAADAVEKAQLSVLAEEKRTNDERIAIATEYYEKIKALTPKNAAETKAQHDAIIKYEKELAALRQQGIVIQNAMGEAIKRNDQASELALKKEQEAIAKVAESYQKFIGAMNEEQDMRQQEITDLGLTTAQQAKLNEQRKVQNQITAQFYVMFAQLKKATDEGNTAEAAAIVERINLLGQEADARIRAAGAAVEAGVIAKENLQQSQQMLQDLYASTSDFFVDVLSNGSKAFENLWARFKDWGLRAIADMASKQLVISIVGALGLTGAGGAAGAGGGFDLTKMFGGSGGFDLTKLFGGSGPGGTIDAMNGVGEAWTGFMLDIENGVGVFESASTAFSNFGSSISSVAGGVAGGIGIGGAIGGLAAELFGNKRNQESMQMGGMIGGAIGSIWGPIGSMVGAAIGSAIGSLIKSGGGPKSGGFASAGDISGISNTDDTGRWFTPNSADKELTTSIKTLNDSYAVLTQALGLKKEDVGFALGYDIDPEGTAPSNVHAGSFVDGQQIYNSENPNIPGQDMAAVAAVLELEAKRMLFSAIQASMGDAPDYIADMFKGIDAATATSEQIDEILNTATALRNAVEMVAGLGDNLNKLKPEEIKSLIAAFGGIENFAKIQQYVGENFTTNAVQMERASGKLDEAFTALGVEKIPKTHAEFMNLIDGLDLTDASQQELYASLMMLAPAFVQVHGTAEQAAQAAADMAAEVAELKKELMEFQTDNFLTDDQKQTQAVSELNAAFTKLGIAVPKTHAEFLALIPTLGLTDKELLELEKTYIKANGTAQDYADAIESENQARIDAMAYFNENFAPPEVKIQQWWDGVHAAWEEYGGQIFQATNGIYSNIPTTVNGFYTFITALQALAAAEEDVNGPTHQLLDAMLALSPTIVGLNGEIANTKEGVEDLSEAMSAAYAASQQAAEAFATMFGGIKSAIDAIVSSSEGDMGDKLALQGKLYAEQIKRVQKLLADEMAKNPYSPLIQQYKEVLALLGNANAQSAAQLARFTILKAQYGAEMASQLVELEEWYKAQKAALGGSVEALAALDVVFQQRWKAILEGVADGVDETGKQLEKLRDNIRAYLDGLRQSDMSPDSPMVKLANAKKLYEEQLKLAQQGDLEALASITKYSDDYLKLARQVYGSTPAYNAIFEAIFAQLEGLIDGDGRVFHHAGTLESALPIGSRLASQDDIKSLGEAVHELTEVLRESQEEAIESTKGGLTKVAEKLDRSSDWMPKR